jgi:predicted phage-related endonuclease
MAEAAMGVTRTEFRNLRRSFIGGSDARIVMGSDEAALIRLWQEKRGEAEPRDLSGNLIVQLGIATEKLNRRWYEANTVEVVTDIQKEYAIPQFGGWRRPSTADFDRAVPYSVQVHVALVVLRRGGS